MKLDEVLNVKAWTPISELNPQEIEEVIGGVYKVDLNLYLRTQLYNRNLEMGDIGAPFVTMAYWASSIEALKRIVLNDPKYDVVDSIMSPPFELTLGTSGLYSELSKKATLGDERASESATYSAKGLFVKKIIEIGRFGYCFASRHEKDEYAFAVEIALEN